jgi:hypothetical protein
MAVNCSLVVLKIDVDEEASMVLARGLLLCATSATYERTLQRTMKCNLSKFTGTVSWSE